MIALMISVITFVIFTALSEALWLKEASRRREAERKCAIKEDRIRELEREICDVRKKNAVELRFALESERDYHDKWVEELDKRLETEGELFSKELEVISLKRDCENFKLLKDDLNERIAALERGLAMAREEKECYKEDFYIESCLHEECEEKCKQLKAEIRKLKKALLKKKVKK